MHDLIPYTFPHSHKTFYSFSLPPIFFQCCVESMSNFLSNNTNPNPNPNKSIEVNQPPTDSVSSLNFSPKSNLLVATSWDNQVLHFFFFFFFLLFNATAYFLFLQLSFTSFFVCRFVVGRLLVMERIMLPLCLRLLLLMIIR